ncbi:MAG TPA: hypothetical protein VGL38_04770 [bacterium]
MTAKNIKAQPQSKNAATHATAPARSTSLKTWQADLIACAVIYLAVFIFFYQIPLQGKTFSRGDDTEAAASTTTFAKQEAQTHGYPLWCPYIFGGFPGMAAGAYGSYEFMGGPYAFAYRYLNPRYWVDVLTIDGLFLGKSADPQTRFDPYYLNPSWYVALMFYGGLLTFLLMRRLGLSTLISLMGGLLMAWNPYLISLATAAHGGKLLTFIYMPLIILAAWNVFEKRRLFDLAILALAFGWQIAIGGHTQILFYSMVTVAILYVVWAIFEWRETKSPLVLKPAAFVAIALLLGFAVGALWYIPLLKYTGFSIRGMGPAIAQAGGATGYSIAEATGWSFSPGELITFIVPSWFGLSSRYLWNGPQGAMMIPAYWGDMPFTSSSFYFGVVPFFFAILAFFGKKDRLFWGLVALSGFSILLSFGSHFQSFYSLFFNYLPFFNKFRTPSLILLLVVLSGIVLAGYGLRFVLNMPRTDKWKKAFLVGMCVCAGILVIALVSGNTLEGLFGSFERPGEPAQYGAQTMQMLRDIRFEILRNSLAMSMLWLGLAFAACWALVTERIKFTANSFVVVILAITAIDMFFFSKKFFEPQSSTTTLETLQPTRVVDMLKQDKSIFRVMPIGNLSQDNRWAAWEVASLGGYHGAKMRGYQDLAENVFYNGADRRMPLNIPFFSAMNCKYFLVEGPLPPVAGLEPMLGDSAAKQYLYRNRNALDRVYFADSVQVISDRVATVKRIADPAFPWGRMAITDKSLPGPVGMDSARSARVTDYTPDDVKISARTSAPSLLVLSDAYYAPGWTAFDNNKETPIYMVNGFVRGIYLQPGDHSIEYRYTGKYEHRGMAVATVSHFLVWGLVIGAFLYERKRRNVRTDA